MNTQPITKRHLNLNGSLDLVTVFPTVQGEGPFAGKPAIFVRLFGCNLQCPLCDTDYTSCKIPTDPSELLLIIRSYDFSTNLIVITGGEPFRQNLTPAVNLLLTEGYQVQIETNGTLYLEDFPYGHENLTIVCSPKTRKVNSKLEPHIAAYKYVLHSGSIAEDGLPIRALDHSVRDTVARPSPSFKGTIYLQPADEQNAEINRLHVKAVIDSCLKFGYTICLQLHKILNLE